MDDFQSVYQTYFTDVYKYVLSMCRDSDLAEEVTQETFFKALKSLDSFRGQCKLYVWLCQIAKNTYFTHLDRKTVDESAKGSEDDSIEDALLQSESALEIHRILHQLEEPYKEVFSLRVFGELSFKQIGVLFGKTENWARVTYHRARLKIKEKMQ